MRRIYSRCATCPTSRCRHCRFRKASGRRSRVRDVDLALDNPPACSPWVVKTTAKPRLYYSQVMFIDQIQADSSGKIWYRVKEKDGTFGDIFWADVAQLSPARLKRKRSPRQLPRWMTSRWWSTCWTNRWSAWKTAEKRTTAGYPPAASGIAGRQPVEKWATPLGAHSIWRKLIFVHMTGGSSGGGYDLAGIGWTTLFSSNGVAVHSTFWHNSFGIPKSHGCVNAQPETQWVFRWTVPSVEYDPGDQTISVPAARRCWW